MGDSRSSSEDPAGDGWVLYRNRSDWTDVTPVPQDDGPVPVVQIAYTERFRDAHDYFRAVLSSGEMSERVLSLTEDCLELNPANYTVWHYRRKVLENVGSNLREELQYCREMIEEHPKNYQVWQHRRVLIERLQDPSQELRFTEIILAGDQKNYHAWQHRQWVLQEFNLFENELQFIDKLLEEDIRNNSAWNQRFFVMSQTGGWPAERVATEVQYAMEKIEKAKRNESAWNYLRGVLEHSEDEGVAAEERDRVGEWAEQLLAAGCDSPHLLGCLVELAQARLGAGQGEPAILVPTALAHLTTLATQTDTVRAKYWNFIADSIRRKYPVAA